MVSIKVKENSNILYPIVPNELKDKNLYGRKILYSKDIKDKGYIETGVWQDLPSEIIEKVYKNKGIVEFKYLKNIPKWIIKEQLEHSLQTGRNEFVKELICNPFFRSRYLNLLDKKELDLISKYFTNIMLTSKQNPNFDVNKLVYYNKKENTIYYRDEVFDYFPKEFDSQYKEFIEYAKFDNEETFMKIASMQELIKQKYYKEAYELGKKESLMKFFSYLPNDILKKEFKNELLEFLDRKSIKEKINICVYLRFPFTEKIENKKLSNIYYKGEKYSKKRIDKALEKFKGRKEYIYKRLEIVEEVFNTKLKEVYLIENKKKNELNMRDIFIYILWFHFDKNIILELYKYIKDTPFGKSYNLSTYIVIPNLGKVRVKFNLEKRG